MYACGCRYTVPVRSTVVSVQEVLRVLGQRALMRSLQRSLSWRAGSGWPPSMVSYYHCCCCCLLLPSLSFSSCLLLESAWQRWPWMPCQLSHSAHWPEFVCVCVCDREPISKCTLCHYIRTLLLFPINSLYYYYYVAELYDSLYWIFANRNAVCAHTFWGSMSEKYHKQKSGVHSYWELSERLPQSDLFFLVGTAPLAIHTKTKLNPVLSPNHTYTLSSAEPWYNLQ